jgi:hypothetical protein
LALLEVLGVRHIELVVHQAADQALGVRRGNRIVGLLLRIPKLLIETLIVLPLHDALGTIRQSLAPINRHRWHVVIEKHFLVVIADDDHNVRIYVIESAGQLRHSRLILGMPLLKLLLRNLCKYGCVSRG